jgi:hypothetical protein
MQFDMKQPSFDLRSRSTGEHWVIMCGGAHCIWVLLQEIHAAGVVGYQATQLRDKCTEPFSTIPNDAVRYVGFPPWIDFELQLEEY